MNNPWFQLVASVLAMVMIANFQYAWTLFVRPIQDATGWKLSDVQWAFTLFVIFETWIMPAEGWVIDRIGPRILITIAGVLCGVGWTGLAFADTLPKLYGFYSLTGVGAAFVYSGCIAAALKWFPNRRGFAAGIIAAGFGAGSALFIPPIAYTIQQYDYKTAFIVTGILQGVIIMLAAQVLRNPGPEFTAAKAVAGPSKAIVRKNTEQFTSLEMLKTPHFYLLYVSFVMMATGGLLLTAQAAPVAREWGISAAALTAALALDRLANGASRISWGWLSDRIGRETCMAIAFMLQAACLIAILMFGRLSGLLFAVTLVAIFFTWGEIYSLFPSTVGDYFGGRNAASNYSFMYTAKGVAAIIGGGLAAILHDRFGSWSAALYGSAVLAMLSALIALGLRKMPLPKKAPAAVPEALVKEV
jgi:OFA family oxalate/formate antiporter-like MFS transporter